MPLRIPNPSRHALRVTRYPPLVLCLLLMGLGAARAANTTNSAKFNLAVDQAYKAIQAGKFTEAEKQIDITCEIHSAGRVITRVAKVTPYA
jgi:hypothetical protein